MAGFIYGYIYLPIYLFTDIFIYEYTYLQKQVLRFLFAKVLLCKSLFMKIYKALFVKSCFRKRSSIHR